MPIIQPIYYYPTVQDALAPFSAGSVTTACMLLCNLDAVPVVPPHATWTNTRGKAVVLLDTVALGGINGLYA